MPLMQVSILVVVVVVFFSKSRENMLGDILARAKFYLPIHILGWKPNGGTNFCFINNRQTRIRKDKKAFIQYILISWAEDVKGTIFFGSFISESCTVTTWYRERSLPWKPRVCNNETASEFTNCLFFRFSRYQFSSTCLYAVEARLRNPWVQAWLISSVLPTTKL